MSMHNSMCFFAAVWLSDATALFQFGFKIMYLCGYVTCRERDLHMPEKSGPWYKTVSQQAQDFSGMVECKRVSLLELKDFIAWGNVKGLAPGIGRLFQHRGM